jgi:small-conductance mechanosensitive channel
MNEIFNRETLRSWLEHFQIWLREDVWVWANLVQLVGVVITLALAWLLAPALQRGLARLRERAGSEGYVGLALTEIEQNALPIIWLALQGVVQLLATAAQVNVAFVEVTTSLLAAWVAIQFTSVLIRDKAARRTFALLAWALAALNVLGWLDPLIEVLDSVAVMIGGFRLSVMVVLKGLLLFVVLLWAALVASRTLEQRLGASERLSASVKVLFGQLSRILFVTVAVVVALAAMGVDLTAFAVFTGALGVGIGLGLQKLVSNLFAGILLLADHSIKPGDVVAVGTTYGWVNFMGARYVSVITRDGTEHLIPNDTLITTSVENWSYSNNLLRLKIPIGISYKCDPHKAIALVLEAAGEVERVLKDPKPVCLLKGFGDSSVDLEARIWINDPRNGISNVKSQVLLRVWDLFHQNGIEIPFPQRDLHIVSDATRVSPPAAGA